MLWAAYASLYHWSLVGTPANAARGEWLISRVYSVQHRPEPALFHARKSLQICEQNPGCIEDFDWAYAYEGMARALALSAQGPAAGEYRARAQEAGEKIKDRESRDIFFGDLKAPPWFGL